MMTPEVARHTITALVEDKPGVLNRISSMFRRRGYNIASLAVGHSEIENLHKLIDVIKVSDVSDGNCVSRELALIRVRANVQSRSEIMQIVDIFRANIVDVAPDSLIIEVTGDEDKVDSLQNLLRSFGVLEVMRTGTIAMDRGMNGSAEGQPASTTRHRMEGGL